MKKRWIAAVCAGLLALVALAIALASRQQPVVLCADRQLSNTELAYYYWSEFFYFSEAYGDYLGDAVDFSKPLDQQTYDSDRSWQDYLLEETLSSVRDNLAMVREAEVNGFALPSEYDNTYQQVLVNFAGAAQSGGYSSTEAYLQASYGRYATMESFQSYLYDVHLAAAYADHLLEQSLPTDEQCREYFLAHQAEYETYYDAVATEEDTWLEQVRSDLQEDAYQNAVLAIRDAYPCQVNRDGIVLTPPQGLYEDGAQ